ncbi:MAG TPA: tRNA pseudouridine(55) synthase TruB [Chloroflexota bacterium]|nr:tRNA pseudouridine(55) synthase TruB [Chloroflexota bacterium]
MKSGILNIHKPTGVTSFDVVAKVRKAAAMKRVGHAGTLDPLASGVLLVCLGQATRVISYLQDAPKVYRAEIKLGERTDTYDAEGQVVEMLPVPDVLDLERFVGDILQTPPLYSALKREGRPLYDYARKGQTVEVEPRLVHVERIELLSWQPPLASIAVHCGKGTYIRSLANDLGGHLTALVREAVGDFHLASALTLDRLDAWENELMPISAALPRLPRVTVSTAEAARLRNGLRLPLPEPEAIALDESGREVAILRDGQPKIVFGEGG